MTARSAVTLTPASRSSFNLRPSVCLQLLGFDWKNCGKDDDPAVLTSFSLSPDPVIIPGDVSAAASGSTKVELSTPLSVGATQHDTTRHNTPFQSRNRDDLINIVLIL